MLVVFLAAIINNLVGDNDDVRGITVDTDLFVWVLHLFPVPLCVAYNMIMRVYIFQMFKKVIKHLLPYIMKKNK